MIAPSLVTTRTCVGQTTHLSQRLCSRRLEKNAIQRGKNQMRITVSFSGNGKEHGWSVNDVVEKGRALAVSLAFSAAVMCAADPVHAVSGGGGMGTSLAFKDFSGQDLRGKNFNKADMRGIDLTGATMEGDQMFGAICADAKFVGTNMRYVDLESADLEGADLTNAVLEGAMLTNTQFKKLKSIEGADFTDALIRRDVQKGLCALESAKGTNPETGVSTRESLNCD